MKKITKIKKTFFNWEKLTLMKAVKHVSIVIGAVLLVCLLVFVFYPDPFINNVLKEQITKAFKKAYPAYTLQIGDIHYNVLKNRLWCDSTTLKTNDSAFSCSVASFSVGGIGWLKIIFQRDFDLNNVSSSVIDANEMVINFHKNQSELRLGMFHLSVPDSEIAADSVKYFSLIDDEQYFKKNQSPKTRFRFDIPNIKMMGLDYSALLQKNIYKARNIIIKDVFADILVNMNKPKDENLSKPQLPDEALSSVKEMVNVESLEINNVRLKYSERSSVNEKSGVITRNKVNFSASKIGWKKIILNQDFNINNFINSVIDAKKIVLNLPQSQEEFRVDKLHVSSPDSEMTASSIKYYPLIDDEQFFAQSKFRQTRFRFDIPQIKIIGLDCNGIFQGNIYKAQSINIKDVFADILVNMDKPYDKSSAKPQMPNELISSIKETIKVDNLKISNGRLKYCERFVVREEPGIITFNNVNVTASGIANHTAHPGTAIINGEGRFMNSGTMKLFMEIPLTSRKFSLRYSGLLSNMDVTELNSFLETGEHHRIKSGLLQSAKYDINVNSGYANGTLRVEYKDLTIAILNKETGSEKGIFNRIFSFIGKVFVIRRNNIPDKNGLLKIGKIKYTRNPEDYFLQFLWFALRNGVGDVVGFSPPPLVSNPQVK